MPRLCAFVCVHVHAHVKVHAYKYVALCMYVAVTRRRGSAVTACVGFENKTSPTRLRVRENRNTFMYEYMPHV